MKKSGQKDPSFGQGLELAGIIIKAVATAAKKLSISDEDVQKVVHKPGVIFNLVEGLFVSEVITKPSITRLIESGVMIEKCDGKAYISDAKNIFKSYINLSFRDFFLNKKDQATEETLLDIHEIVESANCSQIFLSLNTDLDKLVMTQNQIIRFCEKYSTLLRKKGFATFFLVKENNEYFVVLVTMHPGGLRIGFIRFKCNRVWLGEYRHRLVIPQPISRVV
jgi:hypothetical protein